MRRLVSGPSRVALLAAVCVVIACLAAARTYFAFVPRGASFVPWTVARVDGPVLESPDGQRVVRVYFNDAGAMHSGHHWTWVVEQSWLSGRQVVAQGFLGADVAVSGAPIPIQWGPNNEISVTFLPKRYGGT